MSNKNQNVIRQQSKNIEISNIISKSPKKRQNLFLSTVFSLITVLITLIGTVFTFTSMFHVNFNQVFVITVCVVCATLFVLMFKKPGSIKIVLPLVIIIAAILTAIFWQDIVRGSVLIWANVIGGINKSMAWNNPVQQFVWMPEYGDFTTILISLAVIPLSFLISLFMVYKVSILGLFLTTFGFFLSGTAFGVVPGHMEAYLLFAGWTSGVAIKMTGVKNKKTKDGSDFISKNGRHVFARRQESVVSVGVGLVTVALTLAVLTGASAWFDGTGLSRNENIDSIRDTLQTKMDEIVNMYNGINGDGMSNGNLANLDDRVVKNQPFLKLNAPKVSGREYIRGFVGKTYTGNAWKVQDQGGMSGGTFTDPSTNKKYPITAQNYTGALLSVLSSSDQSIKKSFKTIQVTPVTTVKNHAYTFYNSLIDENFNFDFDTMAFAKSKSKYSYDAFVGSDNISKVKKSSLYNNEQFKNQWNAYKEYVHREYTKLPVSGLSSFKKLYVTQKYKNLYEYANYIHEELEYDIYYDTKIEKLPVGQDFAEFFMFNQKKGFCVHFATAATLMFRAAGFPARYVEGYIVDSNDYNGIQPGNNGNYDIQITDKNAHAWVEIFDDNLGWVRYEATPGFYDKDKTQPNEQDQFEEDPDDATVDPGDLGDDDSGTVQELDIAGNDLYILIKAVMAIAFKIAIIISIIFILGGLLAVRRSFSISRRNKRLSERDNLKVTRYVYKYFSKILFFELIENLNNIGYYKYAGEMSEKSKYLDKDETYKAMDIFLKSRFDYKEISDEEAEFVKQFTMKYADEVYSNVKPVQRWIFATVRNLY